jgi:response regulator RpfG family c-di-GMP phosphodiesterase
MDMTESTILQKMLYGTSEALKRAAEAADEDTGMYISRINQYSKLLTRLMNKPRKYINDISKYAQLHDIGKIKVAEMIRLPRKLSTEEFTKVKKHAEYGAAMVSELDGLEMAHNIAIDHHKKYDGSGYPSGKVGEEISLEGRIVAIADVFDALVSERSYKPAYSYDVTFDKMKNGDDRILPTHFDPQILQLFLQHYEEFVELHKKMKD